MFLKPSNFKVCGFHQSKLYSSIVFCFGGSFGDSRLGEQQVGRGGSKGLKLNSSKMECLWIWDSLVHGELPTMVLDGVALPQTDLVHNLGVLMDSQFLLKKQISVMSM